MINCKYALFWWTNCSDWIHIWFLLKQKVYSTKLLKFFSSMPKFIDYLVKFYDFSHCACRNAKGEKSGGLGRAKILVCQQEDWHLTLLWPLLCVGCSKSFARQSCRATGSWGDVGTTQVPQFLADIFTLFPPTARVNSQVPNCTYECTCNVEVLALTRQQKCMTTGDCLSFFETDVIRYLRVGLKRYHPINDVNTDFFRFSRDYLI